MRNGHIPCRCRDQTKAHYGAADSIQEHATANSATFMRQWQTEAIILGWPAHDLFAAPAPAERGGLVYWLFVARVSGHWGQSTP
jgi:hypothetical protein